MPSCRQLLPRVARVILLCLAAPPFASATVENLKSYKAAYPGKAPKAYSCKVCHQGAVGKATDLNAYGQALQRLEAPVDPKKLKPEEYKAVEAGDADGDGATNLEELTVGTDPADPASVPSGQPSSRAPSGDHRVLSYLERLISPEAWAEEAEEGATGAPDSPAAAEYVGTETCAACHAQQFKEFEHSTHARLSIPGEGVTKVQGCEMCHGPGSLHAEAGGGRGVGGIINPRNDPGVCFECHLDKKAEFRLPHHHPVMEGKMRCADCHDAHAPDVRPWSATTLKDINEACFRCHKEQRGPFVWEHEALREGCTTCHKVHGSIHEKMLLVRDNNLCLRCHTQTNFPTIGKSGHAGRLPSATCFSGGCHTAPHGSNFDEHLRY
jgi:predicted CXXCH cytochrome family protein